MGRHSAVMFNYVLTLSLSYYFYHTYNYIIFVIFVVIELITCVMCEYIVDMFVALYTGDDISSLLLCLIQNYVAIRI